MATFTLNVKVIEVILFKRPIIILFLYVFGHEEVSHIQKKIYHPDLDLDIRYGPYDSQPYVFVYVYVLRHGRTVYVKWGHCDIPLS